jgi:UDP-glucose 4-epimerase
VARYLVTGGCGFIGSHLVDALIAAGHGVTILDDLSAALPGTRPKAARVVVGDVGDAPVVRDLLDGSDGCFHLAAVASVPRSNRDLVAAHRTNIGGLITILAAARALRRPVPVVYASSAAVYGPADGPVAETRTPPAPFSHYGCDKLACEHHAAAALESCGVSSIGLRFFNVYGPRQVASSDYSGVLSIFLAAAASRRPVRLFGDGLQTRDFVFVADVVRAQLLAMRRLEREREEGRRLARVVNVCTGVATSIIGLAQAVFAEFGRRPEVIMLPPREGDIRQSVGSPELALKELGFRAATPLDTGVRATVRVSAEEGESHAA